LIRKKLNGIVGGGPPRREALCEKGRADSPPAGGKRDIRGRGQPPPRKRGDSPMRKGGEGDFSVRGGKKKERRHHTTGPYKKKKGGTGLGESHFIRDP